MTALAEKIYNEVLDLPTDERLSLLDKLLHVITIPAPADIEKAWLNESHKRLAAIRSGKTKTSSGESVFQEIKERFQK
ncbi:MAG: addiction module protein [Kiritimatiellaceae bacterium]|nr:addiction module protein [Kiritimatiellaceae bacterium]